MGVLYSAGRDPIFFAHPNVDRMWSIWKTLDGRKRQDITDSDFLDAGFLFYDENARLVRVNIRDCLNTEALGYVYEKVELPWKDKKSTPYKHKSAEVGKPSSPEERKVDPPTKFPILLKGRKAVTAVVPRPKKARTKEEKDEEEEELVVYGIGFDTLKPVKFDVYVNNEYAPGPEYSEFAGSFANVPHKHKDCGGHRHMHKVSLKLVITELLDEIEADNDEQVKVTLAAPQNDYQVTIEGIRIELLS
ncbi:Polyphenol oxidase [Morus notabilis]|uniref:Polyphenol oxidase n=1 Tax=Morus notabilis TaxID=981085 RepID=W9RIG4_9ROSA|nr:Polyphenol oxidase [Morus notabilis]